MHRNDYVILGAALVILVVVGVLAALNAPDPQAPRLSVRNDREDGALLLKLWLEQSGFATREVVTYEDLPRVDVLFLMEPIITYAPNQVQQLRVWVEAGNTLVVTGQPFRINQVLRPFGLEQTFFFEGESSERINQAAPLLLSPPVEQPRLQDGFPIIAAAENDQVVPHFFLGSQPVLISQPARRGQVWVIGSSAPLTNRYLQQAANANLIANIMQRLPADVVIGFDELAHGYGTQTEVTFNDWLFGSAPGWGVLTLVAITFIWIAAQGRRFGRAVPLPDDRVRRESVEYVQAIALLFRRSGERTEVMKHYETQLRRQISERLALNPSLPSAEWIKAAIYADPTLDEALLRDVFAHLQMSSPSEADLVQAAAATEALIRQVTMQQNSPS
jgi:hypothetical protein